MFETKDSGAREEYASGMVRDTQTGKPRYDLIDRTFLRRWAELMGRGADKYGEDNWRNANSVEEYARFQASALRHMYQWLDGDTTEDHATAVAFNLAAAEYVRNKLGGGDTATGEKTGVDDTREPVEVSAPSIKVVDGTCHCAWKGMRGWHYRHCKALPAGPGVRYESAAGGSALRPLPPIIAPSKVPAPRTKLVGEVLPVEIQEVLAERAARRASQRAPGASDQSAKTPSSLAKECGFRDCSCQP